ncbi:MAG: leucine-rich repeat domain-containing protein [Thermodesulfobacteriota bacterium]
MKSPHTTRVLTPSVVHHFKRGFRFARVFLVLYILAAAAITAAGLKIVMDSKASEHWPSTKGVIVSSSTATSSSGEEEVTYPKVVYEYRVGERRITGDRVFFGHSAGLGRPPADMVIRKYRPGTAIEVYYDPKDPERSVLEPGCNETSYIILVAGLFFLLLGGVGVLEIKRKARQVEDAVQSGSRVDISCDAEGFPTASPRESRKPRLFVLAFVVSIGVMVYLFGLHEHWFDFGREKTIGPVRQFSETTRETTIQESDPHLPSPAREIRTNTDLRSFASANPNVEVLKLDRRDQITDLSPLSAMKNLKDLSLAWCEKVRDLTPLSALTGLKKLNLHKCDSVRDLGPIRSLQNLVFLSLPPTTTNEQLSRVISGLAQLETLSMGSCYSITDLSPLAGLAKLRNLTLDHNHQLSDISPLAHLPRLERLTLTYTQVSNLHPIAGLGNLKRLVLWGNTRIENLSALENLRSLAVLSLSGCKQITDISHVARLTGLKTLDISRCPIQDISPLGVLAGLESLDLRGCDKLAGEQVNSLRRALPKCKIVWP